MDHIAFQDSASSDFIGRVPITSRSLGLNMDEVGFSTETARPVMARRGFLSNSQSRHAVIHSKVPMSGEALASKFYEFFKIKESGDIKATSLKPRVLPHLRHLTSVIQNHDVDPTQV